MLVFERSFDDFMILSYDKVMTTNFDFNFVITDYDCFNVNKNINKWRISQLS